MLDPFRSDFNASFTEAGYTELRRRLDAAVGETIEFRVAETPCFFPADLMQRMIQAGAELTFQLLDNPVYMQRSNAAIPPKFCMPGQDAHPHFMTVDFGLVRDAAGELQPTLVEMQAFPSVFGFQALLARTYREVYGLDPSLQPFFSGMDTTAYWSVLREIIVAGHDPEHVILTEVEPESQKTRPDFTLTCRELGIRTVDVAELVKEGNRLFYRGDRGRLVPVARIYNRVIVDELLRKNIALPFDYRDELNVEWAGHPNWYFRISKFSLPYLDHASVPPAVFLDDWYAGIGLDRLPSDRSQWILKPLYSFAGKGIQFGPTGADLGSIPPQERSNYLLQQRVHFEPVIRTPAGPTQAEVRILYAWPDGKQMLPMTSLVRMGRGLMMGVDHNRDQTWVGGSVGFMAQ